MGTQIKPRLCKLSGISAGKLSLWLSSSSVFELVALVQDTQPVLAHPKQTVKDSNASRDVRSKVGQFTQSKRLTSIFYSSFIKPYVVTAPSLTRLSGVLPRLSRI